MLSWATTSDTTTSAAQAPAPRLSGRAPHAQPAHGLRLAAPRYQYLFEDFPEGSFWCLLEGAGADILLLGHTHKPYHRDLPYEHEGETRYRHALTIGSVSKPKPKNGDAHTACLLLHLDQDTKLTDADSGRSELILVEQAAKAVVASPLPNEYAYLPRKAY